MGKINLQKEASFNPWIAWYETSFWFVKAELDKDFIWTFTLKFDELPQEIDMKYTLHFCLNPQSTRDAIWWVMSRLGKKQMEIWEDRVQLEKEVKEKILELKHKYDESSMEMWVHSFEVAVLEFKNKFSNKEIKFLTRLSTIEKIEKLNNDIYLDKMVVFLEKRVIKD